MKGVSIIVNHLTVSVQDAHIVNDVSFHINCNEHLAVIGHSGSGKTSLAKALAGQVFAKGSVAIEYDEQTLLRKKVLLTEQRNQFRNLSHTTDFYYQQRYNSFDNNDANTVAEELSVTSTDESAARIDQLLVQFGLEERRNAPLIQLSSGEHKKFQLIKALLYQPQVLILDMPYTGLDVTARKHLDNTINKLAESGTKVILIADAHHLPDCITHVAVMEKGRLVSYQPKAFFDTDKLTHRAGFLFTRHQDLPETADSTLPAAIVSMKHVTVGYGEKSVLQNITWTIQKGDKWLLKGKNGAGKSTLVSLITGDNPQAYKNDISLFGRRRGTGESIWDIKQKIGYVSPELHAFYDKQTTCSNAIASGFFDTIGLFRKPTEAQQAQVAQWIESLHLTGVQHKPLSALSFGTQRLVLLARALVKNPPLLILDEPCQGMDDDQKKEFLQLVDDLCDHFNKTLIYISHYADEIPACIDHVFELKEGAGKKHSIREIELLTN